MSDKPAKQKAPLTLTQHAIGGILFVLIAIIAIFALAGVAILAGKFLVFAVRL